jgi:hypothetical protein
LPVLSCVIYSLIVAGALPLAVPAALAQTIDEKPRSWHRGLVVGGGYLLAAPQGSFGETAGGPHGGLHVFVGLQDERWSAGIDVDGFTFSRAEERVALPSGPSVSLDSRSDAARISLYGRYGPRFGALHPFAEATVGVQVFETRTTLGGSSSEGGGGSVSARSATPTAGVGVGVMGIAEGVRIGWFVRARVATGGRASYLVFDDETERFDPHASGTTSAAVSIGVLFYPF